VKAAASVEGDDRVRLFCALTIPDDVLDRIGEWQAQLLPSGFRLVPRANLHVTLAFLGARARGETGAICAELEAAAQAAGGIRLRPQRYRATRSVGMLVCEDLGGAAGRLAADLHGRLERIGVYEPERRPWLPHVTVLRLRERPAVHPAFAALDAFSPSGVAVYHSVLRRTGAEYVVLREVPFRANQNVGG
jgi:2'-5' RNA ligase